ncbi:MAG: hypothetical protein ACREBV_06755, partial [Candidatus Zixiibacteriota bacterium]
MATKKIFIYLIALSTLLASSALSQIIQGRPTTGSSGFVYTNWQLEPDTGVTTSLGQFWVPFSGFMALQENLEARYY